ncbi:condensation domain-containing protein, partial [Nostoc flagelliforme]|uniref:condensation domain-containing protein n=1 Tax=Nostoc flagelliforme TaxID=1306274 RepID=UPI001F55A851
QQLRLFLSERLPEYMIPQAIALLDHLPLNHNGKVDRQALLALELVGDAEIVSTVRSPFEELLVGIWLDVLGLKNVGIHDNFFQLGGHSLLATRLVSRLRSSFNVELPLRSVFAAPTISGLAQQIQMTRQQSQALLAPPLLPIDRNQRLQLSFAQARLWFLHQLEPESPQYNMPGALRFTGQLDITALHQSLNEIVRRHEILRTTFLTIDGQPIQVIATDASLNLPIIDLQHLSTAYQETEIVRLATHEAMQPFSLELGPLLRVNLIKINSLDHVLLVTMHHIVSDGWSIEILMREIALIYNAYANGQDLQLPELPIQYADFAHWQRQWLEGEVLHTQLNYWQQQLQGAPPILALPTDRPRPSMQSYRGGTQSFALSTTLTQQLIFLSQNCGVTLFMTLLASFQTLLHWYTGQNDIVIGTDVANRNRAETEGLIGFFVNQLILRTDLFGNPSFRALLFRVREVGLAAYDRQDLPFDKLIEAINPERNLSYQPLFQVKFVLENSPILSLEVADLTISLEEIDNGTAKFDLLLNMVNIDDRLTGTLEYNKDLFESVTINRILEHFETVLTNVVKEPDAELSKFKNLLDEADKKYQTAQEEVLKEARLQKFKNIKRKST